MDTTHTAPAAKGAAAQAGKYLTFALGREEYGLRILQVREIIKFMDVTAVPGTPPHVRGVINLRGQVIPVVDLRARFRMPAAAVTDQTCIVVAEVAAPGPAGSQGGRRLSTGVVVDRVSEVLTIPADRIEDPPAFGAAVDTSFVLGLGKVGAAVKILLDIDRILTAGEHDEVAARASADAVAPAATAA